MKKSLLILLVVIAASGTVLSQKSKIKLTSSVKPVAVVETIEMKMNKAADMFRVDRRLFHSLITAESAFRLKAKSGKGAGCLTQLMPDTARRLGLIVNGQVDERFSNVDKCLQAGAKYLRFQLDQFRDVRLALAGYNAGEGAVMKYGNRVPPYKETVQYVEKICALYYGQSGHGVALAYNPQMAQVWASSLYAGRGRPARALPRTVTIQVPETARRPESDDVAKVEVNKKPAIKRVPAEDVNPRIRTESISFW